MSLCLILLGEGTALDIFKYPNFSNYTAFLCSSILKPDLIIFFPPHHYLSWRNHHPKSNYSFMLSNKRKISIVLHG